MTREEVQYHYKLTRALKRKINILSTLLIFAIGYGVTITWLAHEFAIENQQLTYDLNVSQTAFLIQSNQIAQGLCLPLINMKEK